ncbi:MAG: transposase [SAR324 cluster bacterium]
MRLTDEQWRGVVSEFFPRGKARRRNIPRESRLRSVLEGILWTLRSGAPWQDLPRRFPPHQTCNRWYVRWTADGTLRRVLAMLAADVRTRGGVDVGAAVSDAFHDLQDATTGVWVWTPAPSGPQPWQYRTAQTLAAILILRISGPKAKT